MTMRMKQDHEKKIAMAVFEEREKWEKKQIEKCDNLYKE